MSEIMKKFYYIFVLILLIVCLIDGSDYQSISESRKNFLLHSTREGV